jgi:flagellar biosynthesis/type III secretory pathway M-ring protein FliF/YscJ
LAILNKIKIQIMKEKCNKENGKHKTKKKWFLIGAGALVISLGVLLLMPCNKHCHDGSKCSKTEKASK